MQRQPSAHTHSGLLNAVKKITMYDVLSGSIELIPIEEQTNVLGTFWKKECDGFIVANAVAWPPNDTSHHHSQIIRNIVVSLATEFFKYYIQ